MVSLRKEGGKGFLFQVGKGHCYMDGMVIKIYLTRKGTCKEVGGWCFSSWKEGVDGVGRGVTSICRKLSCPLVYNFSFKN